MKRGHALLELDWRRNFLQRTISQAKQDLSTLKMSSAEQIALSTAFHGLIHAEGTTFAVF